MNARQGFDADVNQRLLVAEIEALHARLMAHANGAAGGDVEAPGASAPHLDRVAQLFGLSPFERQVLLLAAAVELDGRMAAACAQAQGDSRLRHASFSLALAALPDAHWSALTPHAPLRRWRLVELQAGESLLASPLRIDERVLHTIVGISEIDVRVRDLVRLMTPADAQAASRELPASQREHVQRIVRLWSAAGGADRPVVGLWGGDAAAKRGVFALACAELGRAAMVLRGVDLGEGGERRGLLKLVQREAVIEGALLAIDDEAGQAASHAADIANAFEGAVAVFAREPRAGFDRPLIGLAVERPPAEEQRQIWRSALTDAHAGNLLPDSALHALIGQFDLGAAAIRGAVLQAAAQSPTADGAPDWKSALWCAARGQGAPRLEDLAQRIRPGARWSDLVLPTEQRRALEDIVAAARQRFRVYELWAMGGNSRRGLGLSALFAGVSGTGKTLAAEVIAGALELDLYRIDLSAVVNKYIGETEKNLRRIFDAAEEGGAVLLFDEADALFGKRSEVRDSHDRFANIEVSYLLQRMEAYRGLAILTTNMRAALDPAFLRRLRFVVQFPFPDLAQRGEIWRRVFPASTPTEGLDMARLARLNVAGGNIRNMALNAAFLAADADEPVRMAHLLRAARAEFAKLERPISDADIGGWT